MTKSSKEDSTKVIKKGQKVSSGGENRQKSGFSGLDSYMRQFPGALLPKTQIMGCEYRQKTSSSVQQKGGKNIQRLTESNIVPGTQGLIRIWRPALVVHCRERRGLKLKGSNSNQAMNYDYYIHWEGTDRRLDCWLSWESLRVIPNEYLPLSKSKPKNHHSNTTSQNSSDESSAEAEQQSEPEVPKLTASVLSVSRDDIIIGEIPYYHDLAHEGMDEEYLKEHEDLTKVKTIGKIAMGAYMVDTWYYSPYPKEVQNVDILYICEFCLSFFAHSDEYIRHQKCCLMFYPPGNELLRQDDLSMFEVDGRLARVYCENLCFLSKLFLDHKTLYNSVHLFLFYVLTEYDENGYHIVGYFSKEKFSKNNLSCIMILPQYQRKGYGKYLINFSYCLSHLEQKPGSPERPLSDLGRVSYISYWGYVLLELLMDGAQDVILWNGPKKEDNNGKSLLKEAASIKDFEDVIPQNQNSNNQTQNQRTTRSSKQKEKRGQNQINISESRCVIDSLGCCPNTKFITVQQLSDATRIECNDILMTFSEFGLLKSLSNGESLIFLPIQLISHLLQKTGRPATQMFLSKISYTSYENFLAPFECNALQ
ncbi:MOZ/SAS histone aceytl-transferase [Cryptosporidium ryanae]|uniref:MOZ/SAS histone aceytl-transferase n=1 Tax=Cryptosporidium ryanae TaxID=515981 RepID=UPI00351A4574|nr:MOZ/SAS histone aceytl-transferase [Cryptosporidium ryanae]